MPAAFCAACHCDLGSAKPDRADGTSGPLTCLSHICHCSLLDLLGLPKITTHRGGTHQASEVSSPASCRIMTGLKFITTVIFQTFHISWLLLFTVPWTCPVVGRNTTKTLVYFPERGL